MSLRQWNFVYLTALAVALGSLVIISGAWFIELGLGIKPCHLCLMPPRLQSSRAQFIDIVLPARFLFLQPLSISWAQVSAATIPVLNLVCFKGPPIARGLCRNPHPWMIS